MGFLERTREQVRARVRAFVLGPQVVEQADRWFGHDVSEFSPEEYGEYIATSNAVYACATLRAQFLSSLPLKLYKEGRQKRVEVTGGELWELLRKVNPFWTFTRLIEMTELTLCLWGQAFWFLERGTSGRLAPKEMWWGKPDRVRVIPDETNYIAGFLYTGINGRVQRYEPGEVVWLRYPNPLDEYAPLSPIAAARLAADYSSAAMKSNRALFSNGLQMGGALFPAAGGQFTPEQALSLEESLGRRFKGADKAHRWGVFRYEAEMKELGVTPKDAEFLGGLKWGLEEVCRAYKIPLDLMGGERTYENAASAHKAAWTHAVIPEGRFIASELTEQLLPMFGGQADVAEFDSSDVDVLQEAETERWERAKGQIDVGAITINEWREEQGLEPVEWGDKPKGAGSMEQGAGVVPPGAPAVAQEEVVPPAEAAPTQEKPSPQPGIASLSPERQSPRGRGGRMEFGDGEHERLWRAYVRQTELLEKRFVLMLRTLWERQRDHVIARVKADAAGAAADPLNKKRWVRESRVLARPELETVVEEIGAATLESLAVEAAFNVFEPAVVRFIEQRAQRFATEVTGTTWDALRKSLAEGLEAGESMAEMEKRVRETFENYVTNPEELKDRLTRAETIARTETNGAANGGKIEAWRQSGVVKGKDWMCALDERSRESHIEAHKQRQLLDDNFEVGDGAGPMPGQIGRPEEDINCRCTAVGVLDVDWA